MRACDGDAEADVEMMPFVSAIEVLRGHELLPRCDEKRAHVRLVPDVMAGDEFAEPVEAFGQKTRILAAVLYHPLDEGVPALSRRRGAPVISAGDIGQGSAGGERRTLHGHAEDEFAPIQGRPHIHWHIGAQRLATVKREIAGLAFLTLKPPASRSR